MFHSKRDTMKCPSYEPIRANKMEKSSTAESRGVHGKASPVKEGFIKPQCPPAAVPTVLFSLNHTTSAVHNKENSSSGEHEGVQDEVFEDSGYLSLQNSHTIEHHEEEEENIQTILPPTAASLQEETISPRSSPTKCHKTNSGRQASLQTPWTPVDYPRRRSIGYSLSSTPSRHHDDPNLPIRNFQRAVCEELAKSYQKSKRYDWSIVTKVAEDYNLDRVIGGQMGLDFVDMFSALLSRNMRCILSNILVLLSDMDLISCKKVSKTWRKIICEETAAQSRCERAEKTLRESMNSLKHRGCGLTRDVAVSRVVFSCVQTLASRSTSSPSSSSSSSSSSSTPNLRANRRMASCQKGSKSSSQCTRFDEYIQAASGLKQHESLRPCKLCGSPATHTPEVQKATCTRLSCQFIFCTHCQEAFHGSKPCRVVQPRSHFSSSHRATDIIAGSARSKRNVRRL